MKNAREDSKKEKLCPLCIRILEEERFRNISLPSYLCCAYGHPVAKLMEERFPEPEKLPVWAWTSHASKGA